MTKTKWYPFTTQNKRLLKENVIIATVCDDKIYATVDSAHRLFHVLYPSITTKKRKRIKAEISRSCSTDHLKCPLKIAVNGNEVALVYFVCVNDLGSKFQEISTKHWLYDDKTFFLGKIFFNSR